MVTVSDKLVPVHVPGSPTVILGSYAEMITAADYQAFGVQTRSFNNPLYNYRYSFNGKEHDNEMFGVGNELDYGMRVYDPRAGRFLSVDPLTKGYPELTPYQFASNTPIQGTDLDGMEIFYHDPLAMYRIVKGVFLGWTDDFASGGMKVREGAAQLSLAKTNQASYNNPEVPAHVQNMLNQKDRVEGATKMIEGTTDMLLASAEGVSTAAPIGEGMSAGKNAFGALARAAERKAVSGAEKASESMAANALKMNEKALVESGNKSLKILEDEWARMEWDILPTNMKYDKGAHELAKEIGGKAQVRFRNSTREFDAISDKFIGQHKPALKDNFGKSFKDQARATFEAAKKTGRGVYYRFDGKPGDVVIEKLNQYSKEFAVEVIIKY